MTLLTRDALALALRTILRQDYRHVAKACRALNLDEVETRRIWSRNVNKRRKGYVGIINHIHIAGYEIHFTITKKGQDNGTSNKEDSDNASIKDNARSSRSHVSNGQGNGVISNT